MLVVVGALVAMIGYFACWKYFVAAQSTHGNQVYQFSIWPIFGVMIPLVGIFVGWKFLLVGAKRRPTSEQVRQANAGKFTDATTEKLIDIIDDGCSASPLAASSTWLQNNWHNLSYHEKTIWVRSREGQLKDHLCAATDSLSFIKALQDADKEFIRAQMQVG